MTGFFAAVDAAEILGVPLSVATPSALALSSIALMVTAFVRGWVLPKSTVDVLLTQSNERADDWKSLYDIEKKRGDVLETVVVELQVVGATSAKILNALPPLSDVQGKDK